MADELPAPFSYHPAALLGSLVAGPGVAAVASRDAEPEPERPSLWARLGSRVARRPFYVPARAAA
jgi:hypothetical protein